MRHENEVQFKNAILREELTNLRDDLLDGKKVRPFRMYSFKNCAGAHLARRLKLGNTFSDTLNYYSYDEELCNLFAVGYEHANFATRKQTAKAITSYLKTGKAHWGILPQNMAIMGVGYYLLFYALISLASALLI
jgi:hypothetical protein